MNPLLIECNFLRAAKSLFVTVCVGECSSMGGAWECDWYRKGGISAIFDPNIMSIPPHPTPFPCPPPPPPTPFPNHYPLPNPPTVAGPPSTNLPIIKICLL